MKSYADKITGFPDGMTIDEDDNLYIALYGGGAVIKVDPKTANLLKVGKYMVKFFFVEFLNSLIIYG